MCQFEIVLTFCVCPIQIGGGRFSAKYNSATKRFYCAALCLFASPARVEKTNLSGLHPNVNKASAFKAEIFRLDTGWLFKLLPPLFSTKMKNGERANQRLSQIKDFMEQQLWLALWHSFILVLNGREVELKKSVYDIFQQNINGWDMKYLESKFSLKKMWKGIVCFYSLQNS